MSPMPANDSPMNVPSEKLTLRNSQLEFEQWSVVCGFVKCSGTIGENHLLQLVISFLMTILLNQNALRFYHF